MHKKIIAFLNLLLAASIILASCVGLLSPDFYAAETKNWQAQSRGQDIVDLLLIVPSLLISSILAFRNNRIATIILTGVVLYLTYTFAIYCFDIHFNKLFVVYCLCLGLSFYSLVYLLFKLTTENRENNLESKPLFRFIGFYFIIISVMFYLLWLSEIIPSILQNEVPKSVTEAGLFTNAVHVIDLSVILPAIFITGIFQLRRKPIGFIITPILLTFFVLMDITIGMLVIIMKVEGLESALSVTILMSVLAIISLILLILFFRNYKISKQYSV